MQAVDSLYTGNLNWFVKECHCLLYTSDAADEEDSVDLGGRRIIKKKKKAKKQKNKKLKANRNYR